MSLTDRDAKIHKITQQMENKEKMILQKMEELKHSKKENPLLEEVYNEYANYVKHTKKELIDALNGLHKYISSLKVDDTEKKEDLIEIKRELQKHK